MKILFQVKLFICIAITFSMNYCTNIWAYEDVDDKMATFWANIRENKTKREKIAWLTYLLSMPENAYLFIMSKIKHRHWTSNHNVKCPL